LRGRANTLLGVASIANSFLGGIALADTRIGAWGMVAIGLFLATGILTVAVLFPQDWRFTTDPRKLLQTYLEADDPATLMETRRDLALHMDDDYLDNQRKMNVLWWIYRGASAALVATVVCWLLELSP
jgi:hypothetical protein